MGLKSILQATSMVDEARAIKFSSVCLYLQRQACNSHNPAQALGNSWQKKQVG